MFDPDVYPLNLACWDGRVSKHWHKEEHPLDTTATPAANPAAPTAESAQAPPKPAAD
jgi:hypothetical protein